MKIKAIIEQRNPGPVAKGEKLGKKAARGTPEPTSKLGSFLSGMGFDSAARDVKAKAAADFTMGKQKKLTKQGTVSTTTMSPDGEPETITWNPNNRIMTIDGNKYKKTAKGWEDFNTKEKIDPKYTRELETAFNQVTGRAPTTAAPKEPYQPKIGALGRRGSAPAQPTQPTQPAQPVIVGKVVTPNGVEVVKYSDGVWEIPATDEKVVIPSDLKQLEELLAQQQQEPEPDVFRSNRPAK